MAKKRRDGSEMTQRRIDCTRAELALWGRAAAADGNRSVASWIRARLNEAARRELSDESTGESTGE